MKQSLESGASQREINAGAPPTSSSQETAQYEMTTSDPIPNTEENSEKVPEYLSGLPLLFVAIGLALCAFCVGLDRSIVATAVPKITAEFNSLNDVAWYGSSFLLTTCCFQLLFGKLYAELNITWVFLVALGIFEVGSVVCAAAPNSVALVIGRAVAGIGAAGLMSGFFVIVAKSLPLEKRPVFTGAIGACSGISQMIAPTLGGVFTDRLTWRWCFWINLPLGAATALTIFFFLKLPNNEKNDRTGNSVANIKEFLNKLDLLGSLCLMPFLVCLLLALQWGGTTYAWSNWRVILCLSLFGVLLIAWIYIQYAKGDNATLPARIIRQRSVGCGLLFSLCTCSSMFVVSYYGPIWFQVVKDTTAEQSGINFLAALGPLIVASFAAGALTSHIGYYLPQMIVCAVITTVASGLLYMYDLDTTTAFWAGSLALFGFGIGSGLQMPLVAVQTVLKGGDISMGTSAMVLSQSMGGSIFLAVGQNVFQAKLIQELASKVPDLDPQIVIEHGATGLRTAITEQFGAETARGVLEAYNTGLRQCFLVSIIISGLALFAAMGMEWISVKEDRGKEHTKGV
ncbi:unnamed protein product [Clonostachys rosea]|uniref:Major facilitator superfamily (MFS) profile domain-containing protein n=1 Tax=Bionectria ochroleuca TaxID=29856 RepID=A0ABY6TXP9_BIOOC|nr:unnamed protein product [Clonostachys rosea]